MKNYIQKGDAIELVAPSGGVTSGVGIMIGAILVIAAITAAEGETFTGHRVGVYDHTAETHATDQAWAVGDILYWDATNSRFTKTATGHTAAAVAISAKLSTAATGALVLVPRFMPQSAAVTKPTGGTTTDAEARTAIGAIVDALVKSGVLAAS